MWGWSDGRGRRRIEKAHRPLPPTLTLPLPLALSLPPPSAMCLLKPSYPLHALVRLSLTDLIHHPATLLRAGTPRGRSYQRCSRCSRPSPYSPASTTHVTQPQHTKNNIHTTITHNTQYTIYATGPGPCQFVYGICQFVRGNSICILGMAEGYI